MLLAGETLHISLLAQNSKKYVFFWKPNRLTRFFFFLNYTIQEKSREGKLKGAAMDVNYIIEDYDIKAVRGLAAALELWDQALFVFPPPRSWPMAW